MTTLSVWTALAGVLVGAGLPAASIAAGLKPGLYSIDGKQEICLQAAGTWYSPTLADWSGAWLVVGSETHIFGNYTNNNAGPGNDSIVIKSKAKGSWTEWSNSLSFVNVYDPITVSHVGSCN
jgi:hypothetical protein